VRERRLRFRSRDGRGRGLRWTSRFRSLNLIEPNRDRFRKFVIDLIRIALLTFKGSRHRFCHSRRWILLTKSAKNRRNL